jgi:hypothetical protein
MDNNWRPLMAGAMYENVAIPACVEFGLEAGATLRAPTWNGRELAEVRPWGTIRNATPEANRAIAQELSPEERDEIRLRAAGHYLSAFDYTNFV